MTDFAAWTAGLPSAARRELESFARQVDTLRMEDLFLFGTRSLDREGHRRAVDEATRIAAERGRPSLPDDVRRTAQDWLIRLFNQTEFAPTVVGPAFSRSVGRGSDRAQIASSLSEALLALALADQLDEADRDELLGPWAQLADRPRG